MWKSAHRRVAVADSSLSIAKAGVEPHDHLDCAPQERPWLERRLGQAGTMRRHSFCVTCGKVKTLDGPRGRALGFFLSGLSALKEHLEQDGQQFKMTQAQSRLISKELQGLGEFDDTYGLALSNQIRLYLEAVHRVRPDLEEEYVVRLLPKLKGRVEPSFLSLTTQTSAEAMQPRY